MKLDGFSPDIQHSGYPFVEHACYDMLHPSG
jgi:hypothetical protein